MEERSSQRDDWQECPEGTLQRCAQRHRRRQRVYGLTRAAGAAVVVLAFVGLTWWSVDRWSDEREYHFGGIACSDVRANIQAYAMGALPVETVERIRVHLEECPRCQEMMRRMQRPAAPAAVLHPAGSSRFHRVLAGHAPTCSRSTGEAVHLNVISATPGPVALTWQVLR